MRKVKELPQKGQEAWVLISPLTLTGSVTQESYDRLSGLFISAVGGCGQISIPKLCALGHLTSSALIATSRVWLLGTG